MTTGADREDAVSDLLCDLMHLADEEEADFSLLLKRAEEYYEAEVMEDE